MENNTAQRLTEVNQDGLNEKLIKEIMEERRQRGLTYTLQTNVFIFQRLNEQNKTVTNEIR